MLKLNDTVVHETYGAGTMTGFRTLTHDGEDRNYYCIELVENRGTLMIPVENIEESALRLSTDMRVIAREIKKAPETLDNDHRVRRELLEKKLKSGKPKQIAQVLRDLNWRDNTSDLTQNDKKLRESAFRMLVEELALRSTTESAQERVRAVVEEAMARHLENGDIAPE